jgi:hypothetical protein
MPVSSQGHYGFHSFPVVDWFCLFIHLRVLTFPLLDCSVILFLPLFTKTACRFIRISFNISFIVFGLTRLVIRPTICSIRGEHHIKQHEQKTEKMADYIEN